MKQNRSPDPMEALVEDALSEAGIAFVRDTDGANPSGLDFRLPDHGVEIEVKRFHSNRIAEQMARAPNVIAVQGEGAVRFLCSVVSKADDSAAEEDDEPIIIDPFHRQEALHTTSVVQDMFEKHVYEHVAIQADPDLKAAAEAIADAMANLYQLCGAKFINEGADPASSPR